MWHISALTSDQIQKSRACGLCFLRAGNLRYIIYQGGISGFGVNIEVGAFAFNKDFLKCSAYLMGRKTGCNTERVSAS